MYLLFLLEIQLNLKLFSKIKYYEKLHNQQHEKNLSLK